MDEKPDEELDWGHLWAREEENMFFIRCKTSHPQKTTPDIVLLLLLSFAADTDLLLCFLNQTPSGGHININK